MTQQYPDKCHTISHSWNWGEQKGNWHWNSHMIKWPNLCTRNTWYNEPVDLPRRPIHYMNQQFLSPPPFNHWAQSLTNCKCVVCGHLPFPSHSRWDHKTLPSRCTSEPSQALRRWFWRRIEQQLNSCNKILCILALKNSFKGVKERAIVTAYDIQNLIYGSGYSFQCTRSWMHVDQSTSRNWAD